MQIEISAEGDDLEPIAVDLRVLPTPVIFVHGVNENPTIWSDAEDMLLGFNQHWDFLTSFLPLGLPYDVDTSVPTTYQSAKLLAADVEAARKETDAPQVDIVAHSTGGLVARDYVGALAPKTADGEPVVRQIIMLGTPNLGTPCATISDAPAMYNARTDVVARLNRDLAELPTAPMTALAGRSTEFTCPVEEPGDSFTAVTSALSSIDDTATGPYWHSELPKSDMLFSEVLPRLIDGPGAQSMRKDDPSKTGLAAEQIEAPLAFAQALSIDAEGKTELAIQVDTASRVGVAVEASPALAIELANPDGTVVASSAAGHRDDNREPLRVLASPSGSSPAKGEWTLRVVNPTGSPVHARASAFLTGSPTYLSATAHQDKGGHGAVNATLFDGDEPMAITSGTAIFRGVGEDVSEIASATLSPRDDGSVTGSTADALPDGDYLVTVRATTADGLSRAQVTTLRVAGEAEDDEAPEVHLDLPDPTPSGWYRDSVTATVSPDDHDGSGVDWLDWAVTGAVESHGRAGGGRPARITIEKEGLTTLTWSVTDLAGNSAASKAPTQIRVDTKSPAASLRDDLDGARIDPGITLHAGATCEDPASGIDTCVLTVQADGHDPVVDLDTDEQLPTDRPGTYTVTLTATDNVGHERTTTAHYTVLGENGDDPGDDEQGGADGGQGGSDDPDDHDANPDAGTGHLPMTGGTITTGALLLAGACIGTGIVLSRGRRRNESL